MSRPTIALHITTRLLRDALSRALHPHADVLIVPDCPDERRSWSALQKPVDVVIMSGVDTPPEVAASVVVEVPPADGPPSGRVLGEAGRTICSMDELWALLGR